MTIRNKPSSCRNCPLEFSGTGFIDPEGSGVNGVLIVGEAAGEAESIDSLPFRPYAQAGSILERCINRAGLRREEFALYNLVACRPPNNKLEGQRYERSAIDQCSSNLAGVIDRFRSRVLLALGNIPLKHLTGMAGKKKSISLLRGFVYDSVYGIPVIPSLHPAFIARGASKFIPVLIRDLLFSVDVAKNGVLKDEKHYVLYPTVDEVREYLNFLIGHPGLPIGYDIETDYSLNEPDESDVRGNGKNIVQIQFSHEVGHAIVLPWVGDYIDLAAKILSLPNDKWGWNNWSFHDVILGEHNVQVAGENYDLMWCWHHLQPDLPRGLQFVASFYAPELRAWKHLSDIEPQYYGGVDVDALSRIGAKIFEDLDRAGIRRSYQEHIVKLHKSLEKMCKRGFPVNLKRREEFRERISQQSIQLEGEINSKVPDDLKKIHPPAGFKTNPREVREIAKILGVKLGKGREAIFPDDFKRSVRANTGLSCKVFDDGNERFFRHLPFLASSDEQIKSYIRVKGHKMPLKLKERDSRGNPKETTEKKGLERLYKQTGDNFYLKVIESRELQKIASTYIDGWKLDDEGRVHSEFLFAPATGQLSSRNPCIQNTPKQGELADEFRKIITPKPGHVFLEFDYTAFHALTLGFESKDIDYLRLARLDIHSYLAVHLLRLKGCDSWLQLCNEDLEAQLAEVKSAHKDVRDRKAKPTVLGYGFGLGAAKLYDMNLESFGSKKEAQNVIDMLNSLFPATAQFREDIKKLASGQGFLLSKHGYIRRFHDIYGYRQISDKYEPAFGEKVFVGRNGKRYKKVTGDEGESAIAFLPANDAFGHIKDVILRLEELGLNERYRFINQLHDALFFECPKRLVDECLETVSLEMERPSTILTDSTIVPMGLACGIEASIGKDSWLGMDKVYKTDVQRLLNEQTFSK